MEGHAAEFFYARNSSGQQYNSSGNNAFLRALTYRSCEQKKQTKAIDKGISAHVNKG